MKKRGFIFSLFSMMLLLGIFFPVNAQDSSSDIAHRHTALRYLQLAKNYAVAGRWDQALLQAQNGNLYDSKVADLHYIIALSSLNLGSTRYEVINMLDKTINSKEYEWLDYSQNSARILYADLLCSTGENQKALDVLDANPLIFSADAEYIRIKSYYQIGTEESLQKARNKVESVRKIYPNDLRFPRLFFSYEYLISYYPDEGSNVFIWHEVSDNVKKIADSFIKRVPEYDRSDSDIEMYAAIFSEGDARKRLLQSFKARGFTSPLYPTFALEQNLLTEDEALDYFLNTMDSGAVDLINLESFSAVLQNEDVKKRFAENLESFSGIITLDVNRTGEANLVATYDRGRVSAINYDYNNDGIESWNAICDFGVPKTLDYFSGSMIVDYQTYPFVSKISGLSFSGNSNLVLKNETKDNDEVFISMVDETFEWSPFTIAPDSFILDSLGIDFFIILPNKKQTIPFLNEDSFLQAMNQLNIPGKEVENSRIQVSVLNGKPYEADYFVDDVRYAHANFALQNGTVVRSVDKNGNGDFELTETYAYDTEDLGYATQEDYDLVASNLLGSLSSTNSKLYLKLIQLDSNKDTNPDFTEEYLPHGGRISSWDTDNDGKWDLRYEKFSGDVLIEKNYFYLTGNLVTITSINGEPTLVNSEGKDFEVVRGSTESFYWVGDKGPEELEQDVFIKLKKVWSQGVSVVSNEVTSENQETGSYAIAVRVADKIFARYMQVENPTEEESGNTENLLGTELEGQINE